MEIYEDGTSRAGGKFKGLTWGSLRGIEDQGMDPWILIQHGGGSLGLKTCAFLSRIWSSEMETVYFPIDKRHDKLFFYDVSRIVFNCSLFTGIT
jgi:hypothetical protein